jgi:uncharacterized membrane protein
MIAPLEAFLASLVVHGYERRAKAEEVFGLAGDMQKQELLDLADATLAWRAAAGTAQTQQAIPTTAAGPKDREAELVAALS